MNRGWKGIVGALSHVDVIVGMDRLLSRKAIAADYFDSPIRNDFIDIHVARRSRAGLKTSIGNSPSIFPSITSWQASSMALT